MKLENVNPFELKPNEWNSNKVSRDNLEKLKKSVSSLEMFKPLIVRETATGLEILAGYHRNEAAKELGIESVPVLNLGPIEEQKAKEISIIDNTRYGEDDSELLEKLINSMDTELIGTAMPELASLEIPDLSEELTEFEEHMVEESRDFKDSGEDSAKFLKFRYDDLDQAEEIEDILIFEAKENGFYFGDGYPNLSEALYNLIVRKRTK